MTVIRLYRGDFKKINLNIKKTSKNNLFGQGIYLTTNEDVARSYSGELRLNRFTYERCKFPDRKAVLEQIARSNYPGSKEPLYIDLGTAIHGVPPDRIYQRVEELHRSGLLKLDYKVNGQYIIAEFVKRTQRSGVVSAFDVDRKLLFSNIIYMDEPINDPELLQLIAEGYGGDTNYFPFEAIFHNRLSIYPWIVELFKKGAFREKLKEYGIMGVHYKGGCRIGGFGCHDAFCIWDVKWLDKHRVA